MKPTDDPLTYPNSPVLRNRLDITDGDRLRKLEYAVANARLRELKAKPIEGNFDLDHLKKIHAHLLKDIYAWAGKTRDEVYKTDSLFTKGSTLFAMQAEIKPDAARIFGQLAKENYLRGHEGNKDAFVAKLTDMYVAINKLHPFREGNGRATQEFVSQVAKQAGYEVDYSKVEKRRWNESARDSAQGDCRRMQEVFNDIVSPSRAVAFDTLAIPDALKKHPELENAFRLLLTAKHIASEKFESSQDRIRFVNTTRENISARLHRGKEIVIHQGKNKEGASKMIDLER